MAKRGRLASCRLFAMCEQQAAPEEPVRMDVEAEMVAASQPLPEDKTVVDPWAAGDVEVAPCGEEAPLGLAAALERMSSLAPPSGEQKITGFHSVRAPGISIADYVKRIRQFFGCSTEAYVLAMVYIDRVIKRHPDITVSPQSCHRLIACGMTLAAKFQDDVYYSNKFYAKCTGLKLEELNNLEKIMLTLLDYRLFVSPAEFKLYHQLLARAAEVAA